MLMRIAGATLCVAIAVAAPAQDTKKKETRREIVVEGCVEKTWLKVRHDDQLDRTYVDKYRLHGSKDLIQVISKDLNGHRVELSGLLDDPAKVQGDGSVMPIGKKGRVYINAKEMSSRPAVIDPALEVPTFRDISPNCQ